MAMPRNYLQRSDSVKKTALTMRRSGNTPKEIREKLDVPESTLRKWVAAAKVAGTFETGQGDVARPAPRKPGSGSNKRKVSDADILKIDKLAKKKPFLFANEYKKFIPGLERVNSSTIRRHLIKLGHKSCRAARKPFLTNEQKLKRLDWVARHKGWSRKDWGKVLWSDECNIEQFGYRCGGRVRRHSTISRYNPCYTIKTVKHSPKLMVWGCFGGGKLGKLFVLQTKTRMNSLCYKMVLEKFLDSSFRMTGTTMFMQDSAPCHVSKMMKAWFAASSVDVLEWVGSSPDLNPIENLWQRLKRMIRAGGKPPGNLKELELAIKKAWREMSRDTEYLQRLCDSMPRRLAAVEEAGGAPTRY